LLVVELCINRLIQYILWRAAFTQHNAFEFQFVQPYFFKTKIKPTKADYKEVPPLFTKVALWTIVTSGKHY
jgi:hypothetical protein